MTETRRRGALLWFNETRRDGLIAAEDGERYPVLASGFVEGHLPVGRCAGTLVDFELEDAGDSVVAVRVSVPVAAEGGRARNRSRR